MNTGCESYLTNFAPYGHPGQNRRCLRNRAELHLNRTVKPGGSNERFGSAGTVAICHGRLIMPMVSSRPQPAIHLVLETRFLYRVHRAANSLELPFVDCSAREIHSVFVLLPSALLSENLLFGRYRQRLLQTEHCEKQSDHCPKWSSITVAQAGRFSVASQTAATFAYLLKSAFLSGCQRAIIAR